MCKHVKEHKSRKSIFFGGGGRGGANSKNFLQFS